MHLKKVLCGFLAALFLFGCSADEQSFSESSVIPDGWQTYSWFTDLCTDFKTGESAACALPLELSLPNGWTLEDSSIYDEEKNLRGVFDRCYAGYTGELNCNDFYMMLELDGIVTENGVTGSRRRITVSGRNVWCQGIYGETAIEWEYYVWTGENHLRLVFYSSDKDNKSTEESLYDTIIGTITFSA